MSKVNSFSSIPSLASDVRKCFILKKRDNGQEFYCVKDNIDESMQWLSDLCYEAHADMLPDDHIYQAIVDALDAISEYDSLDDARESLEADVYLHALMSWVSSHIERIALVDDALKEFGADSGLVTAIQYAQVNEKQVVFDSVVNSLEEKIEE